MVMSPFSCRTDETRLIRHKDTLYKLKVTFKDVGQLCEDLHMVLQQEAEEVVRAVLYMVENNSSLVKIQTDHFLVRPSLSFWKMGQILGFRQDGKVLNVCKDIISLTFLFSKTQNKEVSVRQRAQGQETQGEKRNTTFDPDVTRRENEALGRQVGRTKATSGEGRADQLTVKQNSSSVALSAVSIKKSCASSHSERGSSSSRHTVLTTRRGSGKDLTMQKPDQNEKQQSPRTISTRQSHQQESTKQKSTGSVEKYSPKAAVQTHRENIAQHQSVPSAKYSLSKEDSPTEKELPRRKAVQDSQRMFPPTHMKTRQQTGSLPKSAVNKKLITGYTLQSRSQSPVEYSRPGVVKENRNNSAIRSRKWGAQDISAHTKSNNSSLLVDNLRSIDADSYVTAAKHLRLMDNGKMTTRLTSKQSVFSNSNKSNLHQVKSSHSLSSVFRQRNTVRQPGFPTSAGKRTMSTLSPSQHHQQQILSLHHSSSNNPQRTSKMYELCQTVSRNTLAEDHRLKGLISSQNLNSYQQNLSGKSPRSRALTFEQKDRHVVEEGDLQEELKLQMLASGDTVMKDRQQRNKRNSSLIQIFTDNAVTPLKQALHGRKV